MVGDFTAKERGPLSVGAWLTRQQGNGPAESNIVLEVAVSISMPAQCMVEVECVSAHSGLAQPRLPACAKKSKKTATNVAIVFRLTVPFLCFTFGRSCVDGTLSPA